MRRDPRKYLQDILTAGRLVARFTEGRSFSDYESDPMLRAAVERQFEIIGEALNLLSKQSPELADRITERRRIISFRNVLIHGYAEIDHRLVWGVVEANLHQALREVASLLDES